MNQKIKYYTLLTVTVVLVFIYIHDGRSIQQEVKFLEHKINNINSQLKNGSKVINEMNQIRKDLTDNRNSLKTYQVSNAELLEEISYLNYLAEQMEIQINGIEVDPRNTFPDIIENKGQGQIELERYLLKFILNGNFLDIGNFIETLDDSESPLKIHNCSIYLDTLEPKGVIAEMEYITYSEGSP